MAKTINRRSVVVSFLLVLFLANSAFADCNSVLVNKKMSREVTRLKAGDKNTQDYPSGRKYYSITFDGGESNGCIVYHAIEGWNGSNAVSEYVTIFNMHNGNPILKDTIEMGLSPWKEYRQIDFDVPPRVEKDNLIIAIKLYATGDGNCCPSILHSEVPQQINPPDLPQKAARGH